MNRYYCSECMVKHAGLAIYHLTYGEQAKAFAHLHEALREAPILCERSLRVIRSAGCVRKAVEIEAEWLLSSALYFRVLEAATGTDTTAVAETNKAVQSAWNERPAEGVQGCEYNHKLISIDVSVELLRIYVGEMLSGYVETQLAMAVGVLSEYEDRPGLRDFRKTLVAAVVRYKAGSDVELKTALHSIDGLFR